MTFRTGEWNDPEYLQGLREHAAMVTLTDGAAKTVSIVLKREVGPSFSTGGP